ncbi:MAG: hypothetical protein M1833_004629 [Piccolia ochrophora]|nr:MAG: hypothetical protein M1833_004629 [Piccolia ochrophora]
MRYPISRIVAGIFGILVYASSTWALPVPSMMDVHVGLPTDPGDFWKGLPPVGLPEKFGPLIKGHVNYTDVAHGSCGFHLRQFWQAQWGPFRSGHVGFHATVAIKDAKGRVIGTLDPTNFTHRIHYPFRMHPLEVGSLLNDTLIIVMQNPDEGDDLYFRFGDDMWAASDESRCKIGGPSAANFHSWLYAEDMFRDMDCGFKC